MTKANESSEAVVIGAGIIGAAIALALARQGKKVHCIDRLPAAGYGSTSGSCAIIRPYYSTVDGTALAYESHFYWQDWKDFIGIDDERGLAHYNQCGCIVMKTEQNGHLQKICNIMDEVGVPYRQLDEDQLLERLPFISMQSFAPAKRPDDKLFGEPNARSLDGAIFFPDGGFISDPQLATHNLQRAAEDAGAEFWFNAEVASIEQQGGRVVGIKLTDGGTISATVVVNVAGPHSYRINQMAGVVQEMKIKTRALRHEVAHVPSPVGFDAEKDGVVYSDSDIATYMRPEQGNHLMIGSEDPPCDQRQWVDPDDFDRNFSDQWNTQVLRMAQRIPELGVPTKTRGVVDLYDVSDDWIPIYDKSDLPGYYMAIGTSGNQFKNAPVVGEMMAELIATCQSGHDHDNDPVHFKLPRIDREVSIGFYSRLRAVNQDSSFSVLG